MKKAKILLIALIFIIVLFLNGCTETNNNEKEYPICSASASPMSGDSPLTVSFTGSGTDYDGNIVSYQWDFDDGDTSTSQNPSHTFTSAGSYYVKLTITDNDGLTDTDYISIEVQTPQLPDLTIEDFSLNPAPFYIPGQYDQLTSGTTYTITVLVTNKGPGSVYGNVAIRLDYWCESGCSSGILGEQNRYIFVGQIGVGERKNSDPITITLGATGTYRFWFKVDPDNIYQESDDSDLSNIFERYYQVI